MKKIFYFFPVLLLFAVVLAADSPKPPVALVTGLEGAPKLIKPAPVKKLHWSRVQLSKREILSL